jgi:hypothetical protein
MAAERTWPRLRAQARRRRSSAFGSDLASRGAGAAGGAGARAGLSLGDRARGGALAETLRRARAAAAAARAWEREARGRARAALLAQAAWRGARAREAARGAGGAGVSLVTSPAERRLRDRVLAPLSAALGWRPVRAELGADGAAVLCCAGTGPPAGEACVNLAPARGAGSAGLGGECSGLEWVVGSFVRTPPEREGAAEGAGEAPGAGGRRSVAAVLAEELLRGEGEEGWGGGGRQSGAGAAQWRGGRRYEGEWQGGRAHGAGVELCTRGEAEAGAEVEVYLGEFSRVRWPMEPLPLRLSRAPRSRLTGAFRRAGAGPAGGLRCGRAPKWLQGCRHSRRVVPPRPALGAIDAPPRPWGH